MVKRGTNFLKTFLLILFIGIILFYSGFVLINDKIYSPVPFSIYEIVEQCSDGSQNYDETGVDCGGSCSACSVGGDEGDGGSSGGGGGSSGGISISTIQTTGFKISTDRLSVKSRQGESRNLGFVITNTNNDILNVNVSSNFDMIDLDAQFSLEAGEEKTILLNLVVGEDKIPNLYMGKIYVDSEDANEEIVISVEVISKESFLSVRLNIPSKFNIIIPGELLMSTISLIKIEELGEEVSLSYMIKDEEGNSMFSENETVEIGESSVSFSKTPLISEDFEYGKYVFYVRADYGGMVESSSLWFDVEPNSFKLILKRNILWVVLGFAVLVILIGMIIVYFRRRGGLVSSNVSSVEGEI